MLWSAWGVPAFADDSPQALAVPRTGTPFLGSLASIDEDWTLTFDAGGVARRMPATELVYWGTLADGGCDALVLLDPSGWLPARLVVVREDRLMVESDLWQSVVLPRSMVRGMLLQVPTEPLERDKLARSVRAHRGVQDHFWLANGDEMPGRLLPSPADGQAPSMFGLDKLSVVLGREGDPTTIPVEGVLAVALAPADEKRATGRPGSRVYMGFRNGACLLVDRVSQTDHRMGLSLSPEMTLVADLTRIQPQIVMLQPAGPEVRYLSDGDPIDRAEVPFLDQSWPYGRDRNVFGGRLKTGGRIYLKGLGMHSTSRLVYDLRGGHRTFAAEIALDDLARGRGSVTFRVFVERDGKWASAFESPVVRGGDAPLPVRVDIRGASRIALVVDYADYGDVLDCADWLHARLIKAG
ncbi:MAG: NPCBM/NEW2 domain-containing protein [Pirellulaceae bacterium]